MPAAFVPFLPSARKAPAPGAPGVPPRPADAAAATGAFAALVPGAGPPPACAPGAKPVVSLQKDGERVTHIRIQCSCGEVIELECDY